MIHDPLSDLIKEAEGWKHVSQPDNHLQAVAWAKDVFDRLRSTETFTAGNDVNAAFLRLTYTLAQSDPVQYLQLASYKADWFDGLKIVCAEMLRRGDEMPQELAHWIADTLDGKVKRPNRTGGRPIASVHEAAIWMTVSQLVSWGWTKSRNDVSPAVSACDVVAEALEMSFDRIKEIIGKGWIRQRYFLRDWDFFAGEEAQAISPHERAGLIRFYGSPTEKR